jgi:hypothetical protein
MILDGPLDEDFEKSADATALHTKWESRAETEGAIFFPPCRFHALSID